MRLNGLDLNLLIALNELLTEKNVSRAGQRLFLSQSAMSGALARLREFFGDDLLVVVGRKMALTPLAERLAEPVREALIHIESTIVSPPQFDPSTSNRKFSLLVSDYVTSVLMQPLIERLSSLAPGIGLVLCSQESGSPTDMLANGQVDLLIIPSQYVATEHPSTRLFDEDYVCVTWQGSRKIKKMTLQAYTDAEHVATHFSGGRNPAFDTWILERHGIKRKVGVVSPWLVYPTRLVIGTHRIATVHRRLALSDAKHLPIKLWEPPMTIPHLTEAMQWHRVRGQDPAITWLRLVISEVAAAI